MKALTICQPYADLILLPKIDPRFKRTENRTWLNSFRGPLLIHAGKSRQWLGATPETEVAAMVFGAIVGVVRVIDWMPASRVESKYPQLKGNRHIEGPNCIVMCDVRRFPVPIPYKGAQGLFEIPDDIVAEQIRAASNGRRAS